MLRDVRTSSVTVDINFCEPSYNITFALTISIRTAAVPSVFYEYCRLCCPTGLVLQLDDNFRNFAGVNAGAGQRHPPLRGTMRVQTVLISWFTLGASRGLVNYCESYYFLLSFYTHSGPLNAIMDMSQVTSSMVTVHCHWHATNANFIRGICRKGGYRVKFIYTFRAQDAQSKVHTLTNGNGQAPVNLLSKSHSRGIVRSAGVFPANQRIGIDERSISYCHLKFSDSGRA